MADNVTTGTLAPPAERGATPAELTMRGVYATALLVLLLFGAHTLKHAEGEAEAREALSFTIVAVGGAGVNSSVGTAGVNSSVGTAPPSPGADAATVSPLPSPPVPPRRHALAIGGTLRAALDCLPAWHRFYEGVELDVFANVGATEPRFAVPGNDNASLAWLRALPNAHIEVEDLDFDAPANLPPDVRAVIPGYPYPVEGPDNPAPHVLATAYRRWRLRRALDEAQRRGNFTYATVLLLRPDTCPCDAREGRRMDPDALFPAGQPLPADARVVLDSTLTAKVGGRNQTQQQGLLQWMGWAGAGVSQFIDDGIAMGGAEAMRWFLSVFESLETLCGMQHGRFHPESLDRGALQLGLEAKAAREGVTQELLLYSSPVVGYCLKRLPNSSGGVCDWSCNCFPKFKFPSAKSPGC
jgi:hypothetical protein